jgi:hypothetical protein
MKWIGKGEKCMSDLHREIGIMYKHLHELKHTFIDMNWIYIEKDNRKDIMYLTDYGKEIVVLINSLLKTMNMYDADIKQYIEKGKLKKVVKVDIKQLKNEMNE